MSQDRTRDAQRGRGDAATEDAISTDDTLAASQSGGPYGATVRADSTSAAPAVRLPAVSREHYEIGGELARGGMGRILRARDQRLGRPVAVKELISEDPKAAARFMREAALTARLQHPSIVPIYEAGAWENGAPFYAMKMVEGRSLDRTLAETETLGDRLALLPHVIAAADALAYAHSRRVIHRDLKPANVIVGAYGETVIIDWGLGKDLSEAADDVPLLATGLQGDAALTVVGSALGTPAYMPPEQARGQEVDETADVYALGAMLYHVLAGKRPYADTRARSAEQALSLVVAAPPPPLEELAPDAPDDLRAIVSKAMARDRHERYPNAKELADDLKRYATGKLVGAHQYTTRELFGRWIRRHRAAVAAATAAGLALLVVGAVSIQRIRAERTEAREQRALAEQNRGEVEGLLDFMLSDLRGKLKPIGQLELLDMVSARAVDYYARRPRADETPDETYTRATAHSTYADVLWRQGKREAALANAQTALDLFRRLASEAPDNADWQFRLSHVLFQLGDMHRAFRDIAASQPYYDESHDIRKRLAESHPEDVDLQIDLASSVERLAYADQARGDLERASERFLEALSILETAVQRRPDHASSLRNLAAIQSAAAYAQQLRGDIQGALSRYRASLGILERLVDRDPGRPDWQSDLAILRTNVGDIEQALGHPAAALEQFRGALALLERLTIRDPRNTSWRRGLAIAHSKVGHVLQLRGELDEALAEQRRAAEIRAALNALDPEDARWRRDLANSYVLLASLLAARGERDESRVLAEKCGALFEATAEEAEHFYNAACCFSLAGNRDRAFEMLERCIGRGFANSAALERDGDLAPLHADPRWTALIAGLRETAASK